MKAFDALLKVIGILFTAIGCIAIAAALIVIIALALEFIWVALAIIVFLFGGVSRIKGGNNVFKWWEYILRHAFPPGNGFIPQYPPVTFNNTAAFRTGALLQLTSGGKRAKGSFKGCNFCLAKPFRNQQFAVYAVVYKPLRNALAVRFKPHWKAQMRLFAPVFGQNMTRKVGFM